MNIEQLYQFCLSKKGVTEHFPFDRDTLVFKVGGKMFAISSLDDWETGKAAISLKCNPEKAQELRASYNAINPGWHLSKIHWNTVGFNDDVSDQMVCELINHSYDLVFGSLTKKIQSEILELEN